MGGRGAGSGGIKSVSYWSKRLNSPGFKLITAKKAMRAQISVAKGSHKKTLEKELSNLDKAVSLRKKAREARQASTSTKAERERRQRRKENARESFYRNSTTTYDQSVKRRHAKFDAWFGGN